MNYKVGDWVLEPCCPHGKIEGEACETCKMKTPQFKVGDRVRATGYCPGSMNVGDMGTVIEKIGGSIWVQPDSGAGCIHLDRWKKSVEILNKHSYQDELTPSSKKGKSMLQKLSSLAQSVRRAFSADQKALYQAGYINEDGKWTAKAKQEAQEELVDKFLEDNKAEFVDRAKEIIALAKEEKGDCE